MVSIIYKILIRFDRYIRKAYEYVGVQKNIQLIGEVAKGHPKLVLRLIDSRIMPNIQIGHNCDIAATIQIYDGSLLIGNYTSIRDDTYISCKEKITIGNNVFTADHVFITDNNNHPTSPKSRYEMTLERPGSKIWKFTNPEVKSKPITIGNNVWIGRYAVILKGVEIGDGSIISASAVVTKSCPPNSIVCGNPAHVVKTL
jgi:acetyltransferase-like isoleucine patch superfamily enzyme